MVERRRLGKKVKLSEANPPVAGDVLENGCVLMPRDSERGWWSAMRDGEFVESLHETFLKWGFTVTRYEK